MNYDDKPSSLLDNITFSIDIDNLSPSTNVSSSDLNSTNRSKRTVKIIHCGDGIVEECEEDELEKERMEKEKLEKELEEEREMDTKAKTMNWLPWSIYMTKRTAVKTYRACDYAGEKLAWWLGITKPKFLYEIEEALRIQKEQEEIANQDMAEKLVVSSDGKIKIVGTTLNPSINPQFTNDDEHDKNLEAINLSSNVRKISYH